MSWCGCRFSGGVGPSVRDEDPDSTMSWVVTLIMTGGEVNGSFVLTGHDESGAL
jgi:hypothetical protein